MLQSFHASALRLSVECNQENLRTLPVNRRENRYFWSLGQNGNLRVLRRLHSTESTGTRQKSRPERGNSPKQTKEPKAPYPHNRGIPPCVCRADRPCKTRGLGGGMHDLPRSCHGGMGVWVVGSKVSWGVEVTTRMMFGCIFEIAFCVAWRTRQSTDSTRESTVCWGNSVTLTGNA